VTAWSRSHTVTSGRSPDRLLAEYGGCAAAAEVKNMASALSVDWHAIFVPSGSLLEIVVRGSLMYLLILAAFRIFRRDAGSLGMADLLVVVLVADAAQNGMAGEYKSLTEGVVLVATIFLWNYLLDWWAYRSPFIYWLMHPPPLLLIEDGRLQRRNLRSQLMTREDLLEQLREQGVEDITKVKACRLEGDGRLSVIKLEGESRPAPPRKGET
jgi:uncharacterized membrane protein YcaP (DUF421 family)